MTTARHPKLAPVAPIGLAAAAACPLAAVWALWPVTVPPASIQQDLAALSGPESARGVAGSTNAPFDAAAFHTPLWVAVAPEPVPQTPVPPAPPPVPPLRATLLAIARDGSHAIVHDQDAGRIATLRVGDAIQGRVVSRIEPARITLTLDGRPETLDLGYQIGAAHEPPQPPRRDAAATSRREAAP